MKFLYNLISKIPTTNDMIALAEEIADNYELLADKREEELENGLWSTPPSRAKPVADFEEVIRRNIRVYRGRVKNMRKYGSDKGILSTLNRTPPFCWLFYSNMKLILNDVKNSLRLDPTNGAYYTELLERVYIIKVKYD